MSIWGKKLIQDEKSIQDRFAVPIAISYFQGAKMPKKAHKVKFTFLTMNVNQRPGIELLIRKN